MKERAPRKRTAQHRAGDACKESARAERQIVSQSVKDKIERIGSIDNRLIHASEVAEELGVSVPYASKIVKKLNEELKKMSYKVISGTQDATGSDGRSSRRTAPH